MTFDQVIVKATLARDLRAESLRHEAEGSPLSAVRYLIAAQQREMELRNEANRCMRGRRSA